MVKFSSKISKKIINDLDYVSRILDKNNNILRLIFHSNMIYDASLAYIVADILREHLEQEKLNINS